MIFFRYLNLLLISLTTLSACVWDVGTARPSAPILDEPQTRPAQPQTTLTGSEDDQPKSVFPASSWDQEVSKEEVPRISDRDDEIFRLDFKYRVRGYDGLDQQTFDNFIKVIKMRDAGRLSQFFSGLRYDTINRMLSDLRFDEESEGKKALIGPHGLFLSEQYFIKSLELSKERNLAQFFFSQHKKELRAGIGQLNWMKDRTQELCETNDQKRLVFLSFRSRQLLSDSDRKILESFPAEAKRLMELNDKIEESFTNEINRMDNAINRFKGEVGFLEKDAQQLALNLLVRGEIYKEGGRKLSYALRNVIDSKPNVDTLLKAHRLIRLSLIKFSDSENLITYLGESKNSLFFKLFQKTDDEFYKALALFALYANNDAHKKFTFSIEDSESNLADFDPIARSTTRRTKLSPDKVQTAQDVQAILSSTHPTDQAILQRIFNNREIENSFLELFNKSDQFEILDL